MRKILTEEQYEKLIAQNPEDRVGEPSGDLLHDKICGILIAYSKIYDMRNGWIDILTIRDAEKEIRKLLTNK